MKELVCVACVFILLCGVAFAEDTMLSRSCRISRGCQTAGTASPIMRVGFGANDDEAVVMAKTRVIEACDERGGLVIGPWEDLSCGESDYR